jgi:hypothetical protein
MSLHRASQLSLTSHPLSKILNVGVVVYDAGTHAVLVFVRHLTCMQHHVICQTV